MKLIKTLSASFDSLSFALLLTVSLLTVSLLTGSALLAAPVTYPGGQATDTAGTQVTSGVSVAVASVTDLDGTAVASPGAVAHVAGGNVSAVYDVAAHGEAWVTLTLTASGHTFNALPIFCSSDPNGISTAVSQTTSTQRQADLTSYGTAKTSDVAAVPGNTWAVAGRTITGGTVGSVTGSVGSISGITFPSNFGTFAVDSTGRVTLVPGQSTTASNFVAAPTPAQNAAAIVFPATVSLSSADEAKIISIGADTPGTTLLLGRPTQTGDTYGLLSPLISSGKLTAAALSNVPGSGNLVLGDFPSGQAPTSAYLVPTITHNGSSQPVLSWLADSTATGYLVLRSVDNRVSYQTIATVSTSVLTYTDTTRPTTGTVYYHVVPTH